MNWKLTGYIAAGVAVVVTIGYVVYRFMKKDKKEAAQAPAPEAKEAKKA